MNKSTLSPPQTVPCIAFSCRDLPLMHILSYTGRSWGQCGTVTRSILTFAERERGRENYSVFHPFPVFFFARAIEGRTSLASGRMILISFSSTFTCKLRLLIYYKGRVFCTDSLITCRILTNSLPDVVQT